MELTLYDKQKFYQIQTLLETDKWYSIEPGRPDRTEFIEMLKKYIQCFGNLEINYQYDKFRLTLPFEEVVKSFEKRSVKTEIFGDPELHRFYATEYPKKQLPLCTNIRDEILHEYWLSRSHMRSKEILPISK